MFSDTDDEGHKKNDIMNGSYINTIDSELIYGQSLSKKMEAKSGQVVVMDPYTGDIIAMADYPKFNPNSFHKSLKLANIKVASKLIYHDHYEFTDSDINTMKRALKDHNASIVITTEKDMVKIRKVSEYQNLMYLGIEVDFRSGEEELKQRVSAVL